MTIHYGTIEPLHIMRRNGVQLSTRNLSTDVGAVTCRTCLLMLKLGVDPETDLVLGPCPCGRPIASLMPGLQRCHVEEEEWE